MDLQNDLIESSRNKSGARSWRASTASIAAHALLIGGVIYAGSGAVKHKVDAEKPIAAFITQGAAPPPPPPPPPPPASSSSAPRTTARVEPKPVEKPVEIPQQVDPMTPPVEVPEEVPVAELPSQGELPEVASDEPTGGVVGGVEGGVAGGIVGGEIGGVEGGEIGGVQGGVLGGVVGGQLGGTGTGTAGDGTGGADAPTGPLRVGGNVKAPIAIDRAEPDYTETARKARITGVVIVEAIIDKQGNVDNVRVLKGLPGGLDNEAIQAVKKWRFRPGTLNGEPVATIFNLTVNFQMNT